MAANEKEKTIINPEEEKQISKIYLNYNGTEYTLEFNARVVKSMERKGFKVDMDYPMSCAEDLFLGAFQMHHKNIMPDFVRKIWAAQTQKPDLVAALVQCFYVPYKELMNNPDGVAEDADPTWKAV